MINIFLNLFSDFVIYTKKPNYMHAIYTRGDGVQLSLVMMKLADRTLYETAIKIDGDHIHGTEVQHVDARAMLNYYKLFKKDLIKFDNLNGEY